MSNQPLPHDLKVATTIRQMIAAGVSMSVIFDKVKDMANGPRSYTTFYKIYRSDIADARAGLHTGIGTLIMTKALDGDVRMLELVAKTKMGWNEKMIVEEVDPDSLDEDTSAIDDLIARLGLKSQE